MSFYEKDQLAMCTILIQTLTAFRLERNFLERYKDRKEKCKIYKTWVLELLEQ